MKRLKQTLLLSVILGIIFAIVLTGIIYASGFGTQEYTNALDIAADDADEVMQTNSARLVSTRQCTEQLATIFQSELPSTEEFSDAYLRQEYLDRMQKLTEALLLEKYEFSAAYFRINPELTGDGTSGFFLVRDAYNPFQDGGIVEPTEEEIPKLREVTPTDMTKYAADDREHVAWWYETIEAKNGTWLSPYYNANNGIYSLTYSIPIYDGDTLIGVVGVDYDFDLFLNTFDYWSNDYDADFTVVDSEYNVLNQPNIDIPQSILREISVGTDMQEQDNEILGQRYRTYSIQLDNGFQVIMLLSYETLTDGVRNIVLLIILGTIMVIVVLVGVFTVAIQRAFHTAEIDSMTGAYNRNAYNDETSDIDSGIGHYRDTPFAILIFDINGLKKVNDTKGHSAGDAVIIDAYNTIKNYFPHDKIYRIGGDEYAIIAVGHRAIIAEANLVEFQQAMDKRIDNYYESFTNDQAMVSVGIAWYHPEEDSRVEDVFSKADEQMYQDKQSFYRMHPRNAIV